MSAPRIAILGAGLAGLSLAHRLTGGGGTPGAATVRLFDKGRAAGGRLATRRAEAAGRALQFDHGAQYLTARTPGFAAVLAAHAAPWDAAGPAGAPAAARFVGTPGMSALPRALARGLDIAAGRHVAAIEGRPGAWMIRHWDAALVRPGQPPPPAPPASDGPFDAVAITLPAPQAAPLLAPHAPAAAARLAGVVIAPCWTVLAAFGAPLDLPDWLRPEAGPIGWAARDGSKPGRPAAAECWVVQAGPDWSRKWLERDAGAVTAALLHALAPALPAPIHAAAHRWRYSLVEVPLGAPCWWDAGLGLGLAGDWCLGARAEAAFESGAALGAAILG